MAVGERFETQSEQEHLDAILLLTETQHGWPTMQARAQLHDVWALGLDTT